MSTKKSWSVSRRAVLRGAGVSVALPLLGVMGRDAHAQAGAAKRAVFHYTTNGPGMVEAGKILMLPSGGEADFALTPELKPFEPYRKELLILDTLDNAAGATSGNVGHHSAPFTILTGADIFPGGAIFNPDRDARWGIGGISIDQELKKHLPATQFGTLELGAANRLRDPARDDDLGKPGTVEAYLNATGRDQVLPVENNPFTAFNRIFENVKTDPTADGSAVARLRARRQSVIDAAKEDYASLKLKLGAGDRATLDKHLDAIRQLERTLDATGGTATASCGKPVLPTTAQVYDKPDAHKQVGQLMMDIIAMAFACDLARVVTMYWNGSSMVYSWLGHKYTQHAYAHNGGDFGFARNTPEATARLREIETWNATQIAYLAEKLKGIPGAYENTLQVWTHELGEGASHRLTRIPFFLLGNLGGAFKTGRHLKLTGRSNNDLYVSILNAFGVPATTFGTAKHNKGPLPLG